MSHRNTIDDVWDLIDVADDVGKCWLYRGRPTTRGYGQISVNGRRIAAHRAAYESQYGPIPEGLVVDHQCHNLDDCNGSCPHRLCCNPMHLQPVTNIQNIRNSSRHCGSRTRCLRGHEYNEANTRTYRNKRYCRVCYW